jgi:pimeloyl-ACP methyl ester carboxylesterase
MTVAERTLDVVFEGSKLYCGAAIPDEPRGVLVLLHGIPSVAPPEPGDLGYPGFARLAAESGWLAVWGDMRAVRRSEGYFSMEGWVRDAGEFVRIARSLEEGRGLPFGLAGSSAGGAVFSEVVARGAEVDALALLAAPASWISFAGDPSTAVAMIQLQAGMALAPETLADPDAWAAEYDAVTTERTIGKEEVPTLILHGDADDVVPVEHAYRLKEAAPNAKLEIVPGAGHQLRRNDVATKLLFEWFDEVLG